ncbi:ABC transporter substrate-binding protein [Derxia gummosa]|uniref:ABC transporter substrate-binding protein n=1 Tax=Derxia gummosa DSM 723 TaxID=1121388 RepID=A0A8B6X2B4_9BURK|nr:ABC transporter substrate-binding protein [Derxia gummosa]
MKLRLKSLVAGVLACCALAANAADKLTVQLDWLPGGDKAFLYAGVKEGFFSAEGLDVTILPGRGSADAVTKVASGAADIATGGLAALMMAAAETPVPVKAVMSIYSRQPDALFTVKGAGITSLKSVAGKTVATPTFSSSNALWPVVLEANGVDPASVKLLKVDPSALAPMLAQGKVDATINWTTVQPAFAAVLRQAGKELAVLPWSAYGLDGYGWSVFAGDKLIKEKPEVVKRFVRAALKSLDFAVQHPDKAAADLKAAVPEGDVAVLEAEFRSSIPLIQNDLSKRDGLGAFEPKLLAATWGWVAKSMNYAPAKVDPEKLVDRSFAAR